MSGMDHSVGARNRRAGGRQAINSGGIAEHSTKEWSWVGCKGIGVLAVFPSLNFELPISPSTPRLPGQLDAFLRNCTAWLERSASTLTEYQEL